ncbi:MAG: hypothetical protein KA270_02800 [Saprospiraceae bacterium]|nr:hypothetical protein [Saprospiraceae bacterium]
MKTGIELIAQERAEQIEKHGRTIKSDVEYNSHCELSDGARLLLTGINELERVIPPHNWDREIWDKMISKPYKERLIIAGALIAAEIDRLNAA